MTDTHGHLKSSITRSTVGWLSAAAAAPLLLELGGAAGTGMPAARRASVGSCADETCAQRESHRQLADAARHSNMTRLQSSYNIRGDTCVVALASTSDQVSMRFEKLRNRRRQNQDRRSGDGQA